MFYSWDNGFKAGDLELMTCAEFCWCHAIVGLVGLVQPYKFLGSGTIVGFVGFEPLCRCAFVGPKIFLVGISWVQGFMIFNKF